MMRGTLMHDASGYEEDLVSMRIHPQSVGSDEADFFFGILRAGPGPRAFQNRHGPEFSIHLLSPARARPGPARRPVYFLVEKRKKYSAFLFFRRCKRFSNP